MYRVELVELPVVLGTFLFNCIMWKSEIRVVVVITLHRSYDIDCLDHMGVE